MIVVVVVAVIVKANKLSVLAGWQLKNGIIFLPSNFNPLDFSAVKITILLDKVSFVHFYISLILSVNKNQLETTDTAQPRRTTRLIS